MAIEAIGSLQARPTPSLMEMPTATNNMQLASGSPADLTLKAAANMPQESGIADQLGNRVYDSIDKMGVKLPDLKPEAGSLVDRAKAAMSPQSEVISAGPKSAGTGEQGLEMLSNAFDHAVFMASVNQVLSGVSDTARTLVRQQ